MSEMLGVNRSRISAILNGAKNLQVKSIYRFANALGYSFDIVFRKEADPTPAQPWNKVMNTKAIAALEAPFMYKSGQITNVVFAIPKEDAPSNMIQINQQIPNSVNNINYACNLALNVE
jgi:transcriptional regulator with XRE-family HTH domain